MCCVTLGEKKHDSTLVRRCKHNLTINCKIEDTHCLVWRNRHRRRLNGFLGVPSVNLESNRAQISSGLEEETSSYKPFFRGGGKFL